MEYMQSLMSFMLWGILISNLTHNIKIKYKNWRNVE